MPKIRYPKIGKKLLPNTIVLSCDRFVRYGAMNIIYLDTF